MIARMGNSGLPAAFLLKNLHNHVLYRKSPLNRNVLFGLNRSVFEIKRFKRYFLKRLTRALWEMRFWIRKKAIGAQIEPGIGYLSGTFDLLVVSPYSRVV